MSGPVFFSLANIKRLFTSWKRMKIFLLQQSTRVEQPPPSPPTTTTTVCTIVRDNLMGSNVIEWRWFKSVDNNWVHACQPINYFCRCFANRLLFISVRMNRIAFNSIATVMDVLMTIGNYLIFFFKRDEM